MKLSSPSTVLITGASGGIGKATALYLARRGYHVAATSRMISRLDELMSAARHDSLSISAHQLDINDPASVGDVLPEIIGQNGGLYALINNAGYGLWGCLEDLTMEEVKAQFETNFFAVLRMCQAVLPGMRERGSGIIVNVGSVLGCIGSPAVGAYSATKFALVGLTSVLRMELAQFGIRAVLIEPGLFRSNFHRDKVIGERALDPRSPYSSYVGKIRSNSGGYPRWAADPARVAKTIEKVLSTKHPRPRYAVGIDARLGTLAVRLLPERFLQYVVQRVVVR